MKDLIAFGFQQIKRVGPIIKQMLIEIRKRAGLNSRDFLDSLKNDISTNLDNFYAIKSWFVSIFIFVSIETLDLHTGREPVSTVKIFTTLQKS